jgi:hypothetical protein
MGLGFADFSMPKEERLHAAFCDYIETNNIELGEEFSRCSIKRLSLECGASDYAVIFDKLVEQGALSVVREEKGKDGRLAGRTYVVNTWVDDDILAKFRAERICDYNTVYKTYSAGYPVGNPSNAKTPRGPYKKKPSSKEQVLLSQIASLSKIANGLTEGFEEFIESSKGKQAALAEKDNIIDLYEGQLIPLLNALVPKKDAVYTQLLTSALALVGLQVPKIVQIRKSVIASYARLSGLTEAEAYQMMIDN